jgi:hypothetical protein
MKREEMQEEGREKVEAKEKEAGWAEAKEEEEGGEKREALQAWSKCSPPPSCICRLR